MSDEKGGRAIPAEELIDGRYELVCCGYSKGTHTQVEGYNGWTYGVMALKGEGDECFLVQLTMAEILPQLRKTIGWICENDRSFGRLSDTFGAVWLVKEGENFALRTGSGQIAAFALGVPTAGCGPCDLHTQ